jgi:hypothetical protein
MGEMLPREDGVWMLEITLGMKHEIRVTTKFRSGKIDKNTNHYGYSQ